MAAKKPHLNEFLVRRIPLTKALEALARWESLTSVEIVALGFGNELPALHEGSRGSLLH